MSLILALKTFFKAWKDPEKAQNFLVDFKPAIERKEPEHLKLLGMLQASGRLIDFLKEDISSFDDSQVGAAVRKIHQDCGKSLEDIVTIRPLLDEKEGEPIQVPKGYDPTAIKLVGNVKGEPPYHGILLHRGWKAHKHSLPNNTGEWNPGVLQQAEVEIR